MMTKRVDKHNFVMGPDHPKGPIIIAYALGAGDKDMVMNHSHLECAERAMKAEQKLADMEKG